MKCIYCDEELVPYQTTNWQSLHCKKCRRIFNAEYMKQAFPETKGRSMKYRKKPIVIEAFRFRIDCCPDWFMDKVSSNEIITTETECSIHTLEGWMLGQHGDYIIQGIKGEIYPCKPDIFEASYEPVGE